jgi:hypothetical protein
VKAAETAVQEERTKAALEATKIAQEAVTAEIAKQLALQKQNAETISTLRAEADKLAFDALPKAEQVAKLTGEVEKMGKALRNALKMDDDAENLDVLKAIERLSEVSPQAAKEMLALYKEAAATEKQLAALAKSANDAGDGIDSMAGKAGAAVAKLEALKQAAAAAQAAMIAAGAADDALLPLSSFASTGEYASGLTPGQAGFSGAEADATMNAYKAKVASQQARADAVNAASYEQQQADNYTVGGVTRTGGTPTETVEQTQKKIQDAYGGTTAAVQQLGNTIADGTAAVTQQVQAVAQRARNTQEELVAMIRGM